MTFFYAFNLASYMSHKTKYNVKSHNKQDTIRSNTKSVPECTVEERTASGLGGLLAQAAYCGQAAEGLLGSQVSRANLWWQLPF